MKVVLLEIYNFMKYIYKPHKDKQQNYINDLSNSTFLEMHGRIALKDYIL